MPIKVFRPIKKVDPAFEVKMPGKRVEKIYAMTVFVKGYNHETAMVNFGEAKLYGSYFHIVEVDEGEVDGKIGFTVKEEDGVLN